LNEGTFINALERLSGWSAPVWFRRMMGLEKKEAALFWLNERVLSEKQVSDASWKVFILVLVAESFFLPLLILDLGPMLFCIWPLLPLTVASLFCNVPLDLARREEKIMNKESPRIISCLSMSLHANPSLETAMAFTSERNEGVLSSKFRGMIWDVLTRRKSDLLSAILDFNAKLSEASDGLKQSLYLTASATFEHTTEGMDRLLDKANLLVLNGVRKRVDEYVSSLSVPSMILFSMGLVLPVMLFALLPLLTINPSIEMGSESLRGPDMNTLTVLLLLVFPLVSFLYARSILERNPLRAGGNLNLRKVPKILLAMGISGALALVWLPFSNGQYGQYITLALVILPLCAVVLLLTARSRGSGKLRESIERDFAQALYQIGNRMLTGPGFEEAFEKTASSMKGSTFSDYAKRVSYQSRLSRKSFSSIVATGDCLPLKSPVVEMAMATVVECSRKDPQAAGKVALNLAQNISDIKKSECEIKERLRGVMDMMRHTALFFAPIVMGITSGLFLLIGEQLGGSCVGSMTLPVGLYLVALGLVITYFTLSLSGETDWKEVGFQFASRTPLAIGVFILSSWVCTQGMLSLT
jgi:hypothetical protein